MHKKGIKKEGEIINYLVVVAHPDDEVLGAGATLYKLSKNNKIDVCILSAEVKARKDRPTINELHDEVRDSMNLLGVNEIIYGDFPNIAFNTVPHLKLVQFIEKAIVDTNADVILTHHPSDLNNDHMHTSLACQEAVRIYQRQEKEKKIKELLFMEVLSSTDWALNEGANRFKANVFFEVGEEALNRKIEALLKYKNVIKKYPHPRSIETIKSLALYRGSQVGVFYAECFQSVFRIDI